MAPRAIAGNPASPGIVDGHVHLLRWEVPDVRHRIIPDEGIPAELKRFHDALEQANAVLEDDCEVLEKDGREPKVKPFLRQEMLGPLERWFFGRR